MKNLASKLSIAKEYMAENGSTFFWAAVLGEFIQNRLNFISSSVKSKVNVS